MANYLEWARARYPDLADADGDYLAGIVHEAENNVRPIFALAAMFLVGAGQALLNSLLDGQSVLGADEAPMSLVTLSFSAAYLVSEPLSATWIRRSISQRIADALIDDRIG